MFFLSSSSFLFTAGTCIAKKLMTTQRLEDDMSKEYRYRNDPKFSDTQALANSADPDQTAPLRSSMIRVYTVCHSIGTLCTIFFFCRKTSLFEFKRDYSKIFWRLEI